MFKEEFLGKRILITGAGKGLGRALVKRFHSYGAEVFALSRTLETLKSLEEECPGVKTICVDLADWDITREEVGKLPVMDCLVNNAAFIVVKSVMSTSSKEFDNIFNINVKSVMNMCQIVAAKMITGEKSGSIVNVSSVTGTRPSPFIGAYGMSKAALQMMSQCLAVELAPKNIRVNVFQPAGIKTDMFTQLSTGLDEALNKEDILTSFMINRTPTKTVLMPMDECLNSICFLLSDLAKQIVGHTLTIDGGYLCT